MLRPCCSERFRASLLYLCTAVFAWLLFPVTSRAQDLHPAEADLLHGRADRAAEQLGAILAHAPQNGAAHLLLCRVFLSTLHGAEAAGECQLALRDGLASDSSAQDWAGRALGLQAQHANPLAAVKLALQVHTAFQTAYTLNRRNPAAANDLGEYLIDAPAIVGGGPAKALQLAAELQPVLPEVAHRLRALLAEKQGDNATAEREFLAAAHDHPSPGAWVDVANFYVRQHAAAKAVAAARQAVALDRDFGPDTVDAAAALGDAHDAQDAMEVLRRYVDHGAQTDQSPVFRALTMMGSLFAAGGDKAAARRAFQQALSLAHDYAPAQKGLANL